MISFLAVLPLCRTLSTTMASKSTNLILSVKFILMSTGVIFIALLLSFSLPHVYSTAPNIWSSFRSWLKPPYLYFIINGIIITIAASSRLHFKHADTSSTYDQHHPEAIVKESSSVLPSQHLHYDHDALPMGMSDRVVMSSGAEQYGDHLYGEVPVKDVVHYQVQETRTFDAIHGGQRIDNDVAKEVDDANSFEKARSDFITGGYGFDVRRREGDFAGGKDEVAVEKKEEKKKSLIAPLERQDSIAELLAKVAERPPLTASARFGQHRRPLRAVPEGGKTLLRVLKPKKQETLESTWKAITERRHMPLTRHLKKPNTLENHLDSSSSPVTRTVKKSETFQGRTNYSSSTTMPTADGDRSLGKLKKEASLGQEELNRRVEAFINKFNEDMRLQRQQSIQQFMETINRAI